MYKILLTLLISLASIPLSLAQLAPGLPPSRTCGTMHQYHQHLEQSPELQHYEQSKELEMQQWLENNPNAQNGRATYTFAVVVHVVYNNNSENIPDALIQAQIEQLNQDFSATNSDIGNVPSEFPVGNADIEFKLATIDPNGNPTTGITRTQTSIGSFDPTNNSVKFSGSGGVDAWDTNTYFNIWICNLEGGVLGYAQFPQQFDQGGQNTDGLVLGYSTVGSLNTPNPQGGQYGYGRTATHELGHCLWLYHIWGDDGGGCSGTDQVNDTPNQGNASSGCPSHPSFSCGSNDMTMNYMDYSNDQCMYAFTPGQVARMVSAINSFDHLQNKLAATPAVTGAASVVANFSVSDVFGCAPLAVSFSDQSIGGPSSWTWSFPGGTPASHNGPNPPAITYDTPGTYTASLSVSDGTDSDSESIQIVVNDCGNLDCVPNNNINNAQLTAIPADGDATNNGYISGHNTYNDLAIAEYFSSIPAGAQLNGAEFVFLGAAGSGSIEFVIWENNGGTPGAELYTDQVTIATIENDVSQEALTQVDFGGIINIPTSFFIGFKMVNDGSNQVVLATNSDGDTTPGTAWSLLSDNTWASFSASNNWGVNVATATQINVCTEDAGIAPTANFTTDVTPGCETAQIEFFDASENNPTSWSWSFPGGEPATSTQQNPVVVYTSPGTYNATLVATNANGDNTFTQDEIVIIPEFYTIDASASPTTVDIANGATVNFQDNSPVIFWYWDFGDGNTSTEQNPSHTYTQEGEYEVYLEVSDGFCLESTTFNISVQNSVGVGNITGLNALSIYPNPVSDQLLVDIKTDAQLDLQMEIFNTVGAKVIATESIHITGDTQHTFDVSTLHTGTYFVRITDGQGVTTTKFVKL